MLFICFCNVIMQVDRVTQSCRVPDFVRYHRAGSFFREQQQHIPAFLGFRKRIFQFEGSELLFEEVSGFYVGRGTSFST